MDAAHACRYALGQKNAHGGEEGSPDGLVVTCLVPRERWVLLQPVVVHALHKEGALNLKGQDGSSIRHMGCDFYPGVCLPCDELAQKKQDRQDRAQRPYTIVYRSNAGSL